MEPRSPQWQETTFEGSLALPAQVRQGLNSAVPRWFFGKRFVPDAHLAWITSPEHGHLAKFGTTGLNSAIAIDPATREVVQLDIRGQAHFVNSDIERFGESTKRILELFPLYGVNASAEAREDAAARVANMISLVDPPALANHETYRRGFVDDVANGDFATEEVISLTDSP